MSASIGKWGRTDNEAEGKGWEHDYWQLFGGFQHSTRSRRMSSSRLSRRIMAQRADEEWDHDEWGEGQWEQMEPFEDEEQLRHTRRRRNSSGSSGMHSWCWRCC